MQLIAMTPYKIPQNVHPIKFLVSDSRDTFRKRKNWYDAKRIAHSLKIS